MYFVVLVLTCLFAVLVDWCGWVTKLCFVGLCFAFSLVCWNTRCGLFCVGDFGISFLRGLVLNWLIWFCFFCLELVWLFCGFGYFGFAD